MLMPLVPLNRTPPTKSTPPCRMFKKFVQQGRSE